MNTNMARFVLALATHHDSIFLWDAVEGHVESVNITRLAQRAGLGETLFLDLFRDSLASGELRSRTVGDNRTFIFGLTKLAA